MTNESNQYILTTSTTEKHRLKTQHDLWLHDTINLWQEAKLSEEKNILEIGAGPGFGTFDLAKFLGKNRQITAIELSQDFSSECRDRLKDYPKVNILNANLLEVDLGKNKYDACYGRWICMFLPELKRVLGKITDSLKKDGIILLQEYVDYGAMNLSTESESFSSMVKIIMKSFEDAGGNSNVMRILPQYLTELGMKVEILKPMGKIARPKDPLWTWPTQFYHSYIPTLIKNKYITQEEGTQFLQEWDKLSKEKHEDVFWIGPTVGRLVARKV